MAYRKASAREESPSLSRKASRIETSNAASLKVISLSSSKAMFVYRQTLLHGNGFFSRGYLSAGHRLSAVSVQ